jgi:gamma-glutamylcyclotransferase (GGCT)/AIG2-like uncharacterized protein YtfP
MSRLIGVYGSLREGGSNHHLLRLDSAPAVRHAMMKIPGRLYSLGDYCCAVPLAQGQNGEIVTEIYEIDDDIFESLEAMEREFGYVGIDTTAVDSSGVERTFVVWYHLAAPIGGRRIKSGDWVAFCRSRNQRH